MRVGFYQFSPRFGEVSGNLERIACAIDGLQADVIVLPELATTGYLFLNRAEVARFAEPVPGPTTYFLQDVARRCECAIVIGLAERADDNIYNSAVMVGAEGVVCHYRKIHLFHEEKKFFQPGNLGFPVIELNRARIGLLVCFDHMFPEAARSLALKGAQIICHPSNLVLPEYGQLTTRVRSIENRLFWILANRWGQEERGGRTLTYSGSSQITAPGGTVLAHAPAGEDGLIVIEIDPQLAEEKHVTPLNHLFEDRRPEFYGEVTRHCESKRM